MSREYGRYVRGGAPAKKKFDMSKPAKPLQRRYAPFTWTFARLRALGHLAQIRKTGMEGVKPPYILLLNHNAFYDFYVMLCATMPARGIFPAAVDDYIGREYILRNLGTVPKRKYTADISILRTCRKAIKDGNVFGIYAEARYSLCGVTEIIPEAVAQMVKHMGVPVVTLTCRGHHINDPFWGDHRSRYVFHTQAEMTLAFTPEQLKTSSVEEIDRKINELLYNDDFRWQSENRVKVTYKKRAEGLHRVLYQCPHCKTEYRMGSEGDRIFCEECGKSWTLNYYGELEADDGETEFKFASDWYKWEREMVKKEIEDGSYYLECDVDVNDLPNSKGFVHMGHGKLIHDMEGLHLTGVREYDNEPFKMDLDASAQYAVHIEYKYRFGNWRDCIDMNTLDETWYVFPETKDCSVTKISLATEEMFKYIWNKKKNSTEVKK
ncbi:MAG: hypothetical protein IJU39_01100 [Clostridia bacterium]|nr:hypothetical protein [Clostridia bacterium]